jgi:hypothetical protein
MLMRIARPQRLAGAAACAALFGLAATLGGCAHEPVTLQVRSMAPRPDAPIARPIIFVHAKAFREQQWLIEPYGQGYILPLKAGEASDEALRETYARLFAVPREVESREEFSAIAGTDGPIVLLEPAIVELHYLNASRRMHGPYYAEIDYRFTLTGAGGDTIARWVARGFGQYDLDAEARARTKDSPPGPRAEGEMNAEAPRRAIEAATASFARSFARVPELIRWARGQPVAGTDVAAERQVTRDTGPETPGVEASYPGAFVLEVRRTPIPKPPKDVPEEAGQETNLLALRLTLRNDSSHRLALDPEEIEWDAGLKAPLEPLPAPVAAALVTRLPFGLALAPGTGVAALPALFAALMSAAELSRHQTELAAWSAMVSRDVLVDGVAPGGERRTVLVYFIKPSQADGGTLMVPVVDLDEALRYTVRVPMPRL